MKCAELIRLLEEEFPVKYAVAGDKTGFLVGDREKEIHHVFVAVDATEETIEEAIRCGADFLLTHHPMIYAPMSSVTSDTVNGRRVMKLIRHDLCYMATHTNYDSCRMAELAVKRLGMTECQTLEEVADGLGIGKAGRLPKEMTLRECALLVKKQFQIPSVKYFGNGDQKVLLAGICPGSGRSVIGACHRLGVQVLITGDVDHHTGIDEADDFLPIIDAGHYGIEHIYIEDMRQFLETRCPGLKVSAAKIRHPFETL